MKKLLVLSFLETKIIAKWLQREYVRARQIQNKEAMSCFSPAFSYFVEPKYVVGAFHQKV
jgi:hypothetical protein